MTIDSSQQGLLRLHIVREGSLARALDRHGRVELAPQLREEVVGIAVALRLLLSIINIIIIIIIIIITIIITNMSLVLLCL